MTRDEHREQARKEFGLDWRPALFDSAYAAGGRAMLERAIKILDKKRDHGNLRIGMHRELVHLLHRALVEEGGKVDE